MFKLRFFFFAGYELTQCIITIFLFPNLVKMFKIFLMSSNVDIPVEIKIGFFCLEIYFNMSKEKTSPDGILKKGIFIFLSRNFKLSRSKAELLIL